MKWNECFINIANYRRLTK